MTRDSRFVFPGERELATLAGACFSEISSAAPVHKPSLAPDKAAGFPVEEIRADFPILGERAGGKPVIWLDNASTTQKPQAVIERLNHFYLHENSNVRRGAHALAALAEDAYEGARAAVARFIGADSPERIVFVRGATEGINLVAQSFVKPLLSPGDEIILTELEHHANIVPWQMIAAETGAFIRAAPVGDDGQIILSEYAALFGGKTKFAAFSHVSNALGTVLPVEEMVAVARANGVKTLVDGAQSVSRMPVDVAALDADFFVFSGHKVFGPMGIGAVYGRPEAWEAAKPYQGGGNMIKDVSFGRTVYGAPPRRFEAGTVNAAGAAGLAAALEYIMGIGMENIAAYERRLINYAEAALSAVPGLRVIGSAPGKAGVISFVIEGRGAESAGKALAAEGIAVRAGHHCAQPVLRRFGLESTVRPSFALYNTPEEIDKMTEALVN
jgi:cysteine desulfurase/selenocysteine lyase